MHLSGTEKIEQPNKSKSNQRIQTKQKKVQASRLEKMKRKESGWGWGVGGGGAYFAGFTCQIRLHTLSLISNFMVCSYA